MRSFSLSPFPQGSNFPGQVCVFLHHLGFQPRSFDPQQRDVGGPGGDFRVELITGHKCSDTDLGQLGCQDHSTTKQEGQIDGMELYDIIYVYYIDL